MPDGDAMTAAFEAETPFTEILPMPLPLPLWLRRTLAPLPWCDKLLLLPWLGDSADCSDGLANAAADTGDETLC
jgi:hypothetical protein